MVNRSLLKKIGLLLLTLPLCGFASPQNEYQTKTKGEGLPIINAIEEKDLLPGGFRTSSVVRSLNADKLNLEGLGDLKVSGSSQFSELGLNAILKKLGRERITLVNLRQEDGGFLEPAEGKGAIAFSYLMSMPWWTGENPAGNRSVEQIEISEEKKMDQITKEKKFTCYGVGDSYAPKDNHRLLYKVDMVAKRALTEKQMAAEKNLGYFRIPDKKFGNMEFEHVDSFVKFVTTLPSDEWIHFHCKKGQSRTTLFMVMYDMMRNADRVSADDILERQGPRGLGGADLKKLPEPDEWDHQFKKNWLEFLHHFHTYCVENKTSNFEKPFSKWATEKGLADYPKVVLGKFYKETTVTSFVPDENEKPYDKQTLVINSLDESKLSLSNFRTTQDLWIDPTLDINKKGLNSYYASGSSQYSVAGMKLFLDKIKPHFNKIVVVDLRHDDHVFVNGLNVSTFETKDALLTPRTPDEILASEEKLKADLQKESALELKAIDTKYPKEDYDTRFSVTIKPDTVETPKEVIEKLGADYLLIGSKRFSEASDDDLDRFISFMRFQPKDTWIHFHCKKGKSRTTFFMAIYDMMCNADKLSLEQILERQKQIGGSDLLDVTPKDPSWAQEKEAKMQWIEFLARFHAYCLQQKKHNFAKPWSEWSLAHSTYLPKIDHLVVDHTA